jgi:mRNA interferase MazF
LRQWARTLTRTLPSMHFPPHGRSYLANNIQRGQIYEIDWNPARGSEQAGLRPGLVIQNDIANSVNGYPVTIVCAVSSKLKGYPSMVRVNPSQENGLSEVSEVNSAQIMTVQKDRLGLVRGRLSRTDMAQVDEKLAYMLSLPFPPKP